MRQGFRQVQGESQNLSRTKHGHGQKYLLLITLVVLALHLSIEGYRWQMVPSYLFTVFFFISRLRSTSVSKRDGRQPQARNTKKILYYLEIIFSALFLAIAAFLPAILPVFTLPQPSGQYKVGITEYSWLDSSRPETFTQTPEDKRNLQLQVWYPAAETNHGCTKPYWRDSQIKGPLLSGALGLPPFLFNHLNRVKTYSYPDATLAERTTPYPVILFSHGYNGFVDQNTVQMETLASHGYVVASIAHPYETLATIYPNRDVVTFNKKWNQRMMAEMLSALPLFDKILAAEDKGEQARLTRDILDEMPLWQQSLDLWTADTRFVLDELPLLNATDPRFAHKLDLDRIGVMGMSFGGATAGQVCQLDARCKAGVNLDGLQFGKLLGGEPLAQPFMVMESASSSGLNDFMLSRLGNVHYRVKVRQSTHTNFSDFSLSAPIFSSDLLQGLGLLGTIDGQQMTTLISDYLVAFFNRHLQGKEAPLLEEVAVKSSQTTLTMYTP